MEVTGILKMVGETQDVGSSGFQKRDCVVTTDEQYPQHILVQFVQDKCNLLASFKVGDKVNIGINLRGREWVNPQGETVYFNTIQGWKISNMQPAHNASPAPAPQPQYPPAPANGAFGVNGITAPQTVAEFDDSDDVPF